MKVLVNNIEVEQVACTTFLGFAIDKSIKWQTHIDKICGRVGSACFALKRVSRVVSAEVARACYFATVHSILQYGTELWGRAAEWERVFRMQKRAVRAIVRVPQDTSVKPYFKKLGILTVPAILIYQVAMYVRVNPDLYKKYSNVHSYQTRNAGKLVSISRSLSKSSKLTHVMGPTVYNRLPENITETTNFTCFKFKLKHWLIEQTFYSFDEYINHKIV